ncbi:hypothetical protein KIN20_025782 [Parelaphostrongylus tenuis]|uniref:Uncharacterized protein n=1 Tax=Parelaphostrongylus tenuis TaxID=148309 RepID=A0AAD5MYU6_PARTN|nr:hypothetical protein KIN20_025782 [Parelaphostrongylus tenuis]
MTSSSSQITSVFVHHDGVLLDAAHGEKHQHRPAQRVLKIVITRRLGAEHGDARHTINTMDDDAHQQHSTPNDHRQPPPLPPCLTTACAIVLLTSAWSGVPVLLQYFSERFTELCCDIPYSIRLILQRLNMCHCSLTSSRDVLWY